MGGSSGRGAANAARQQAAQAATQRSSANGLMSTANAGRQAQMDEMTKKYRAMSMGMQRAQMAQSMQYEAMMQKQSKEMSAARDKLKKEQEARTSAGKILGDFTDQERRRLFKARKGVGQIGEEDEAISLGDYNDAKGLLGMNK